MDSETRIDVVPFEPELLPPVRAFSERYWSRPRTDDYYDWRYLRPRAFSRMFVAMRGSECVGTLFALRKTWRLRGEPVPCLEVFDWHALAELRGSGVGLRLMRAMMRQGERLLSVGGTPDVHSTLPLMGWKPLAVADAYELPLSPAVIAERVHHGLRVPRGLARVALAPLAGPLFGPRRLPAPAGAEARVVDTLDDEVGSLYAAGPAAGSGFAQQPDRDVLGWLTASRWSGRWRYLRFTVGGRLRGWAMTRTYLGRTGIQASLLEVFAPDPAPELYAWMVSEACLAVLPDHPTRILARASCPALKQALARNRFRHAGVDAPVHTWPAPDAAWPRPGHFTFLHSDSPILPYDTEPIGAHES